VGAEEEPGKPSGKREQLAWIARPAPRALASFCNLNINTYRMAGRANIAHARRELHDRTDAFAVYSMQRTSPNRTERNNAGGPGERGRR
jgi:hypothetical protein